jgi:hypothetical protein
VLSAFFLACVMGCGSDKPIDHTDPDTDNTDDIDDIDDIDDTGEEDDTDTPMEVTYEMSIYSNAQNGVNIFKADPTDDTCTVLKLVNFGTSSCCDFSSIALPDGWGAEAAYVRQGADDCDSSGTTDSVPAIAGSGTVTLDPEVFPPTTAAVKVNLIFETAFSWSPTSVDMDVADLEAR